MRFAFYLFDHGDGHDVYRGGLRLAHINSHTHTRSHTSTTNSQDYVPQTLQKWRLATIYPDSVCLLTQMHTHR